MRDNEVMKNTYYTHLERQLDFGRGLKRVASGKTVRGFQEGGKLYCEKTFAPVFEAWNTRELFVWSDQHFFHNNICRYADRPFDSVFRMNEVMVQNAQQTLQDDSVVLWGGDVSFGTPAQTKEVLRSIPGKHFLVVGNHDVDRPEKLKTLQSVFLGITDCLTFEMGHRKVFVSHYPLLKSDLSLQNIQVHGHTHQHLLEGLFVNMSVEHLDYKPVLLHDLITQQLPFIGGDQTTL